ncbi:MAG TPA: hypothetical protein VKA55_00200 [Gammaproteobacteria bacterium]|nr:hypothetical protein [Gammaproteobacteria bacterium]
MSAGSVSRLGAHVSAAGGVDRAPGRGAAIGADCIQVLTRNQRQWQPRPLGAEEAAAAHGHGRAGAAND